MARTTRATQALDRAGVAYRVATYDYDPSADRIGMAAAQALGAEPGRVLKTVMAQVDGKPVCVVLPSDREVSMKKLAAAFGGKSAEMMKPEAAERVTGYHVGGVSPFGQKRAFPTAIAREALDYPQVFLNGGQRGVQVELSPSDAARVLAAQVADLTA